MADPTIFQIRATVQQIKKTLAASAYIPLPERQRASLKDPPVRLESLLVSRADVELPEDGVHDIRRLLSRAIIDLGQEHHHEIEVPAVQKTVNLQWVSYILGSQPSNLEAGHLSEMEKYTHIARGARSAATIFFIYGGALLYALNI